MMAGCVHVLIGPTSFLVGFVVGEIIAQLSEVNWKEGLLMVNEAIGKVIAYAKRIKSRAVASLGAHLPYRHSLLTSL